MLGISLNELILVILLMVIFIKPKDIPSVVNAIAKFWKKIKSFMGEIQIQIKNITEEIDETKDATYESFHDKIEKVRLEIEKQEELDLYDDIDKKTPKLKIEKAKKRTKTK